MENKKYKMAFTEAVARLHKRITFKGRATRAEFWYAWIFAKVVLRIISRILLGAAENPYTSAEPNIGVILFSIVLFIYAIFLFFAGWCLEVRRFHDVGLSGWWTVIPPALFAVAVIAGINGATSLAVTCGALWLVSCLARIVVGCLDSKKGRNKYGDSEKYPEEVTADRDTGTPPDTDTTFSLKS